MLYFSVVIFFKEAIPSTQDHLVYKERDISLSTRPFHPLADELQSYERRDNDVKHEKSLTLH